MLIQQLIKRQQLRLELLLLQSQLQHQQLLQHKQQLSAHTLTLISSPPGLMLSFTAGCLFQLRHNSAVKALRTVVGFRWLRQLTG